MAFVLYNANPFRNNTIDCVIRAISFSMNEDWDSTYMKLALRGFELKAPMEVDYVWGSYLKSNGYKRYIIPNTCPDCYTIAEFCKDNPKGDFILATGGHVVAVRDGNYYDTGDSGNEVPIYFWTKETNIKEA